MPVSIVLIVFLNSMNTENKRAKILIKAIDAGCGPDADKLAEALRKPLPSPRELLNRRLLRGCIFTFVGLFLLVMGVVLYLPYLNDNFIPDQSSWCGFAGGASLAVGISYLIVYFVTRRSVSDEK